MLFCNYHRLCLYLTVLDLAIYHHSQYNTLQRLHISCHYFFLDFWWIPRWAPESHFGFFFDFFLDFFFNSSKFGGGGAHRVTKKYKIRHFFPPSSGNQDTEKYKIRHFFPPSSGNQDYLLKNTKSGTFFPPSGGSKPERKSGYWRSLLWKDFFIA